MIFIDTNYFLRFLLKDNKNQFEEAKQLFEKGARGEVKLFTSVIVLFEICWVLFSFYGKKKKEVGKFLKDILSLAFIEFENFDVLEKGINYFQNTNLDLEDAYNIAYAGKMKATTFHTFDTKLKKYLNTVKIKI